MSEQILRSVFPFGNIYKLFGVETDAGIILKMSTITVCSTILIFISGWIIPAPYGRYLITTRFTLNAKFSWMMQESPAIFVPMFLLLKSPCVQMGNLPNQISLAIFMAHYFQRVFVYPFRISKHAKPVPIWTSASAFIVCLWNGFYQGHHLINVANISNSSAITAGVILFSAGMLINIYHDGVLIKLCESRSNNENSHSYEIPRGGLFDYISGANYFGEILEWWGLALATRSFPQIMFAVFSMLFLGQRALHHHNFYTEVFGENYPSDRKAIIPFVL